MSHQTLQHVLPESVPSRLLVKASVAHNFRSARSSQSWKNSQQPRTFEHRLLLFLLTERGLNEDFLTSVLRALRNSRLLCPRCSGSTSRIIGCRSPPSEV